MTLSEKKKNEFFVYNEILLLYKILPCGRKNAFNQV